MCYKGLESLIPTVLLSGNQLTLYCFVSVFSSSVFSASALMMASAAEKAEAKAKGAGKKKKRKAAAPKKAKAKKAKVRLPFKQIFEQFNSSCWSSYRM